MKRKTLVTVLIAEAVFLALLALLTNVFPALFSSLLAFPFEQVALGMKALAGTGAVGNGIALAVLAGLGLFPVFLALRYERGRETFPERAALFALSAVLLAAFFGIISPGSFRAVVAGGEESFVRVIRAFFGLSVWTVVILFVVLRLIRLFRAGSREQLFRYLRLVLCVLCMFFTAEFVISLVISLLTPAGETLTAADVVCGALRLLGTLVPLALDLLVCMRMLALLETAATEEQEHLAEAASRLSSVSCLALAVTAGLSALLHIVQLFLLPYLSDANAAVDIPVTSIFLVVVILLFSRLLIENKRLREDNSLII